MTKTFFCEFAGNVILLDFFNSSNASFSSSSSLFFFCIQPKKEKDLDQNIRIREENHSYIMKNFLTLCVQLTLQKNFLKMSTSLFSNIFVYTGIVNGDDNPEVQKVRKFPISLC